MLSSSIINLEGNMKNDQKDHSIKPKSQAMATKSPLQRVKSTDIPSNLNPNIKNIISWYFCALPPPFRHTLKTIKERPCSIDRSLKKAQLA